MVGERGGEEGEAVESLLLLLEGESVFGILRGRRSRGRVIAGSGSYLPSSSGRCAVPMRSKGCRSRTVSRALLIFGLLIEGSCSSLVGKRVVFFSIKRDALSTSADIASMFSFPFA